MPQFYTLPTEIGQAKMANAIALGQTVNITHMAVGDGNGSLPTPDSDRETLVNEVRRAPINTSDTDDDNPNWIVVEQVIPPDVGGWTIREIGIFDDDGDLIGYGNYPETYKPVLSEGSGRTQTIRFVMEVSDTAAVTLKVDPSVVLATRQYVDSNIENSGVQFANYDPDRTYETGEVTRGSDGQFYEFYDRDLEGTVQGVDPTDPLNRPHLWMRWYGERPGSVIEWRSETLPEGYIVNDGSEVSRTDYRRVFDAIGTVHGAGDGSTTFLLPDDRGEFKRGFDNGRGVDAGRVLADHQSDAIRNITGGITLGNSTGRYNFDGTGAFQKSGTGNGEVNSGSGASQVFSGVLFDASQVVPTADENRTRNNSVIWLTKI